jgi:TolB-like protein/Tfp pilus assembly protein PilF
MRRRLAAVLIADVAGYTRLMDASESETHTRLMALLDEIIRPAIATHHGRMVKSTGDGFLASFGSVNNAVQCAVGIQQAVEKREAAEPPESRIAFRMGLHVGDVSQHRGDVYGAGVNLAARLQELAEPGSVMISAAVREQVGANLQLPTVDLGNLSLKNIANPVRAFRIVTSTEEARARIPAMGATGRPSIAVLPFRTLDPDPEKAYFGECMVEDIITSLATLKELRVISRNSTVAYRGKEADVHQVGLDLGVRYVLSGSVRRGRRRDRITTELADTETGSVLWAQPYDAEGEDLFEVQDSITAQIVGTIAPRVRQAEIQRAFQKRPENMDAYDHVLQAMHVLYRLEQADFSRAGTLLRRAIALDDSYSTAYALAAQWHLLRNVQGWSLDPPTDRQESLRLAQAAVDRDPLSAHALAQLGHLRSFVFRDFNVALALFNRAHDASPSNAWAWGLSAPTYSYIGDGKSAIARAEYALSLSPQDPLAFWYHTSLCIAHYTNGSYEEAAQWGEIAFRENPRYTAGLRHTLAALGALGRNEDAAALSRSLLEVDPNFRVSERIANYPYRERERLDLLRTHLLATGLPP